MALSCLLRLCNAMLCIFILDSTRMSSCPITLLDRILQNTHNKISHHECISNWASIQKQLVIGMKTSSYWPKYQ
ncbi:hypothetical protein BDZ45DRAFT_677124 [Acephala macrosclerotiorum]|nr:hypothetical protein BDZ45DRAFT_677124 [Acephala macrosclerotiorum]